MKHIFFNKRGFTLIEILVSIVVIAIIAVVAGVGLVAISKGYVFSKKNSVITQQGQIAMTRLKKEFSSIKTVTSGTATSITFTRSSGGSPATIFSTGGSSPLLIDSDTLVGPVALFNLTYYYYNPVTSAFSPSSSYSNSTSIIEITLRLIGAEVATIEFKDRVNLYLETGG